ncbi:MAG TPA: uracil-DNA glycosylase [Rhodocyclaceae bacterium]|nr:uracil-DNA glycosylase [Rhodocyclaceae bacterium]
MNPRRESILREMRLGPTWKMRGRASEEALENQSAGAAPKRAGQRLDPLPAGDVNRTTPGESRSVLATSPPNAPGAEPVADARRTRIAGLPWDALESEIRACTACRLCESRQQAVPGIGDRGGNWMMVGEGPGAEEDRRGEPFVGPAGRLLDDMLAAIGLSRSQGVYIANAVKCRPPLNRTPQADEIAACLPYLERQIALVKPKLLVALGRPAAQSLLGEEIRINASRGRLFRHADIPVVVTYHPAYLLRNQTDKGRAWEDLCFARASMAALATPAAD